MISYSYYAVTAEGKKVKGSCTVESSQLLKKRLRNQGLILTSYKKKETVSLKKNLPKKEKLPFVLSLSQLLSAGLPLVESLELLKNQQQSGSMKEAINACVGQLKEGSSFSDSLEGYRDFFDERFIAMIESGEQSGDLGQAVASLLKTLEKEEAKKKKLFSLFFYPGLLLSFSLVVILVVFLVIIPSLEELFGQNMKAGFSGLIFQTSRFMRSSLSFVVPFLFLSGAFLFIKRKTIRILLERGAFKIPLMRTLIVDNSLAELCLTLSLLLKGGVPLLESLILCEKRSSILWQKKLLSGAITAIQEGRSLSASLENTPHLPPLFAKMIAAGEDTGSLQEVALKLANYFEETSQKRLETIMTVAQPLILIIMGALIASIMLAVLLPLSDPQFMLQG
ncbi:MAG: type II secretion system F family protein [Chlamydiota bacterium]